MADLDLDNGPQFLGTLYHRGDIGNIWDGQPSLSHKIVAFSTFIFMVIVGYLLFFVKAFSYITLWAFSWVGSLFGFKPCTELNAAFSTIFSFVTNVSFPFLLSLSLGLGTVLYLIYDYWQPIQRTLKATWDGRGQARGYIPNFRAPNVDFGGLKSLFAGIFNLTIGFFAGTINFFQGFGNLRVNLPRVPPYVWANTAGLILGGWYLTWGRDLWYLNPAVVIERERIADGAMQFNFWTYLWATLSLLRYGWLFVAAFVATIWLLYSTTRAFLTLTATVVIVIFDASVEAFKARTISIPWTSFSIFQNRYSDIPIIPYIVLVVFVIFATVLLSQYYAQICDFLQTIYRAWFGLQKVNMNDRTEDAVRLNRAARFDDSAKQNLVDKGPIGEILFDDVPDAPVIDYQPDFLLADQAETRGAPYLWGIAWKQALVYGIIITIALRGAFKNWRDIEPGFEPGDVVSPGSGYSVPVVNIPGFDNNPSNTVPVPETQPNIDKAESAKVNRLVITEVDGIKTTFIDSSHVIVGDKPSSPTDEHDMESRSSGKSAFKDMGDGQVLVSNGEDVDGYQRDSETNAGVPASSDSPPPARESGQDLDGPPKTDNTKKGPYTDTDKKREYTHGRADFIKEKNTTRHVMRNYEDPCCDAWWAVGTTVEVMEWPFINIIWPLLSLFLSYHLAFAWWLWGWMWKVLTTERNSPSISPPACLSEASGLVILGAFVFGLGVFVINLLAIQLKNTIPASVQVTRILSWLPITLVATHLYAPWMLEMLGFSTGVPLFEYWQKDKYLFTFWLLFWLKIAKTTFTLVSYTLYDRQPKVPFAPGIVPNDVTVVVPVCGTFPDVQIFRERVATLLVEDFHYLLIAPDTLVNRKNIMQALDDFADHKFSILNVNPNATSKRELVHDALQHIDTRITCVTDTNVSWSEEFLKSALAAFENPVVTLVGTSRDPHRHDYGGELNWPNFWNYIACNNIRKFDMANTAAYNIDGGVALIPSSTWLARTNILADIHYRQGLLSEEWLGDKEKYTAEDYYTTRYFTTNGYSVVWINNPAPSHRPNVVVTQTQSSQGIPHLYEAAKVHWRHIIKILFFDATVWRRRAWSSFVLFAAQFVDNGLFFQLVIGTLYWCIDMKPVSWCVLVFLNVVFNFLEREYSSNREPWTLNGLLLRLTNITVWPLVDGLIDFWAMVSTVAGAGVYGFGKVVDKVF